MLYGRIFRGESERDVPECHHCAYQNSVDATHEVFDRMYAENADWRALFQRLIPWAGKQPDSQEKA